MNVYTFIAIIVIFIELNYILRGLNYIFIEIN